jgi:hypothetical protein
MDSDSALINAVDAEGTPIGSVNQRNALSRNDSESPLELSQAAPLGNASFPPASATGAFIAAFSWQPLSGGVMVRTEMGRMTSRFGESRVPKYGRLTGTAENV